MVPCVFLDRDGVIVVPHFREGRSFAPRKLEEFHIYPQARESLARLKSAGFVVAVVSNQPDVGNGLIEERVLSIMHERLTRALPIDAVKVCTHRQNEHCACRKPKPGMILDLARELDLDLAQSFMVGDRASDVEASLAAGCTPIFIEHGYSEPGPNAKTRRVRSIAEAVDAILEIVSKDRNRQWAASAI
jgi:D-glycero-D-manno-heptose 1,7-bisphosphate phosphatase